jgi:hypothetical protein
VGRYKNVYVVERFDEGATIVSCRPIAPEPDDRHPAFIAHRAYFRKHTHDNGVGRGSARRQLDAALSAFGVRSEIARLSPPANQIWPSRTAAPVVLDQIPQHFDDRSGRKYVDELPGNLDLFSPTSPQIEPQVVARAEPEIK